MAQTSAKWGWAGSNYHELAYFKVTQVKQERANNRTQFRVEIWTNSNNSRGEVGTVNWSVGDQSKTRASGSKFISSSSSNYVKRDIANTTFWIKHTSSGSLSQRTFTLNMDRNVGNIKSVKMSVKLSVSSLPQIPNAPTLSLRSRAESSVTLNWSTNMSVSRIRHRVGGGSWTTSSASGTSGTRTVSGLSTGGKTASIDVQVEGPGGWSSTRNTSQRTQHVSTLSSYNLVPTKGYNNRLTLAVKGTQTGGSTTIQYKLSTSSTWINTTGGSISGLANNTSYTVNLRAVNSEGPKRTYDISARTHAAPEGSFNLIPQNKTQITITHSSTHTTSTEYSFNGGAWTEYSSGVKITGLTPGSSYRINVRFINSDTGITTLLGEQSIKLDANVIPSVAFSNKVRYRGHITISAQGATKAQYRYRESGTSTWSNWQTANLNGSTRVPLSGSFTSGTPYEVEARVEDAESKQWGNPRLGNLETASFRVPTVTKTNEKLTSLTFSVTGKDSCKLKRVIDTDAASWGFLTPSSRSVSVTKYNGQNLAANTKHSFSFVFEDEYGKPGKEYIVSQSATTQPLDQASISLSKAANGNLDIIRLDQTQSNPVLSLGTTTGKYAKTTVFTLGSLKKTINWTASKNETLTIDELKAITRAMTNSTTYKINFITSYKEDGRTSLTTQTGGINIKLNNTSQLLLKPPTLGVTYNPSEKKKIALGRLYTKEINQATFSYSAPLPVEGSPIETATISFNGKTQNISKTSSGTITTGLIQNNISNSTAVLTIKDKRGLVATSKIDVLYTNYSYPTVSVLSYGREGGFGNIVQFNDFRMTFTPTTNDKKINNTNTITRVSVRRGIGGTGTAPQELKIGNSGNLMSHMKLGTIGTTGNYGPKVIKIGPGATSNPAEADKWFQDENAYRLEIYARDRFFDETGVEAELKGIIIATGKGIIFFDQVNRQVGVNTTAPRGRFEVDGDSFFENIYALNTFVINEGDLEDI